MITTVNQETDTKVPETITAVGGIVKNAADAGLSLAGSAEPRITCKPKIEFHSFKADGSLGDEIKSVDVTPLGPPPSAKAIMDAYQKGYIAGRLAPKAEGAIKPPGK